MNRLLLGTVLALSVVSAAQATQFNISGHDRFEVWGIFNPEAVTDGGSKTFWTHRLYLKPTLLIDDHFTVFTEWKILEYNKSTAPTAPNGGALAGSEDRTPADGGTASGSAPCVGTDMCTNHYFAVSRAWLDWTSDWGLLRVGRAPRHWGTGMIYNAGNSPQDDYQSTEDMIQYFLPLGFITFSVGFGKLYEGNVATDADDREDYFALVHYNNPEIELDAGFMYNRAIRAETFGRDNYHLIDVYGIKQWGGLKATGEFAYAFGGNSNSSGTFRDTEALGLLAQAEFKISRFTTTGMFAYASGDDSQGDTTNKNFKWFSKNVRPALILFSDDVAGKYSGTVNSVKAGPAVGQFNNDGAIMFKLGESILIADKFTITTDFIYARLATTGASLSSDLGFEVDLLTAYRWYENFTTTFGFGYHVTGDAYGASPEDTWALNFQGVLTF